MTTTVHLDRQGYVDTVFQNTRKVTLDARKYPGTLMEVTGEVCPGMRWDGQRFVTPPPRIDPEVVRAERDRRINDHFPERFRAQVTVFGGENAIRVSRYVTDVQRVAEAMGDDAPQDYRHDRHWPRVPTLIDLPVPQRVTDAPTGQPVNVTIAPVINAQPIEAKPVPLEIVRRTVSDSVSPVPEGEYGLDIHDPLYPLKQRLIQFIEREVEPVAPADTEWKDELGRLAALHTDAQTLEQLAQREAEIMDFLEGKAA